MSREETIIRGAGNTKLDTAVYEPSTRSQGTIIFTPGWSGHHKDYDELLAPIGESYRVLAPNLRGHGNSQGTFEQESCIADLTSLSEEYDANALIGHSAGTISVAAAKQTNPDAVILFNPFFNVENIPNVTRGIVRTLYNNTRLSRSIDNVLQHLPLERAAMNTRRPAENTGNLATIDASSYDRIDSPLMYVVSGRDTVLGTNNEHVRNQYRSLINNLSTDAYDESDLADKLNHCLNFKGYVPFLKDEEGKDKKTIIEQTLMFLEQNKKGTKR